MAGMQTPPGGQGGWPLPTFGRTLTVWCGLCNHDADTLARCLVTQQFEAPRFADDVDALREHIAHIMAGDPWPADLDYDAFIRLSAACLGERRRGKQLHIEYELVQAMLHDSVNVLGP